MCLKILKLERLILDSHTQETFHIITILIQCCKNIICPFFWHICYTLVSDKDNLPKYIMHFYLCPINLINLQHLQELPITLSNHCWGILFHCSLQNCFHFQSLKGFWAWTVCLRPCQIISTGLTVTRLLQNLHFIFLTWCVIDVLMHNPSVLELQGTNQLKLVLSVQLSPYLTHKISVFPLNLLFQTNPRFLTHKHEVQQHNCWPV